MLVFACLIVASLSYATGTSAPAATTKAPAKSAMKSDLEKVSGTIDKIDAKAHTVTVNTGTESKSFTIGSKTVYMEGGKKVKSTVLKQGDKIDVWTDSKNMAHKIEIEPASASH